MRAAGWVSVCELAALVAIAAGHGGSAPMAASGGECCGVATASAEVAPAEAGPAMHAVTPEQARQVYDRIKKLSGSWRGKSTKGWTDRLEYRVIAGESCVMQTSFDAHPSEMMATMIHPDGDRLLLTHYCAAKNQPRLVLSEVSDDLGSVTFTFLDATNLASRDAGHMDKCAMTFMDDDHFKSRWTWYQKGQEQWMEEIEHERVKDAGDQ